MTPESDALAATVLRVARDVLGRENIDLDDDFFAIGGDSLVGMHLVGRLRQETGFKVRVRLLFEAPRLRAFAERLSEECGAQQSQVGADDARATLRGAFGQGG